MAINECIAKLRCNIMNGTRKIKRHKMERGKIRHPFGKKCKRECERGNTIRKSVLLQIGAEQTIFIGFMNSKCGGAREKRHRLSANP